MSGIKQRRAFLALLPLNAPKLLDIVPANLFGAYLVNTPGQFLKLRCFSWKTLFGYGHELQVVSLCVVLKQGERQLGKTTEFLAYSNGYESIHAQNFLPS